MKLLVLGVTIHIMNPSLQAQSLEKAHIFLRQRFEQDGTGHDYWHLLRVRDLALNIAPELQANAFLTELGALLHDVADTKLENAPGEGKAALESLLADLPLLDDEKAILRKICLGQGFSAGLAGQVKEGMVHAEDLSPEAKAVQDADRLDALGAIGIARCFAYGGSKGSPIHDPEMLPRDNLTLESYRHGRQSSLNHFYEKLFKIKSKLHTQTALRLAEGREEYMREFVHRFLEEWQAHL